MFVLIADSLPGTDDYITTAIKQAPLLAISFLSFLLVIWLFLRHLREEAERQVKRSEAQQLVDVEVAKGIANLGKECHAVQREATEVIAAIHVTLQNSNLISERVIAQLKDNDTVLREVNETHKQVAATNQKVIDKLTEKAFRE